MRFKLGQNVKIINPGNLSNWEKSVMLNKFAIVRAIKGNTVQVILAVNFRDELGFLYTDYIRWVDATWLKPMTKNNISYDPVNFKGEKIQY